MAKLLGGKAGSSAGGLARDYASGAMNQRWALERQHQAQDFSAQQFEKRYQTTVNDMKAAGLNPMLAYSQGGGSPQGGSPAGGGGDVDFNRAVNESNIASAQQEQLSAQTDNTKSDTAVKTQEEKNLKANKENTEQQTENLKWSAEQTKRTIDQISSQIEKNRVEMDKMKTDIATGKATQKQIAAYTLLLEEQRTLTAWQTAMQSQQYAIGSPKARAAEMPTGLGGAIADNIWKILNPMK